MSRQDEWDALYPYRYDYNLAEDYKIQYDDGSFEVIVVSGSILGPAILSLVAALDDGDGNVRTADVLAELKRAGYVPHHRKPWDVQWLKELHNIWHCFSLLPEDILGPPPTPENVQ